LQKALAILLIVTLQFQPMINGFVFIDFLYNQEYIQEFLCINREKPKLSCNGKCYLMQQLEETKNEQEKEFPQILQTKLDFIINDFRENFTKTIFVLKRKVLPSLCQNKLEQVYIHDIFHPPRT